MTNTHIIIRFLGIFFLMMLWIFLGIYITLLYPWIHEMMGNKAAFLWFAIFSGYFSLTLASLDELICFMKEIDKRHC